MFEKFDKIYVEDLKKGNKKIKKESLNEFLNSFELDALKSCALISHLFKPEELEPHLKSYTKEDYVESIKDNLNSLFRNLILLVDFDSLDLLYEIVYSKDVIELDAKDINIELICFLKYICFIKAEYIEKQNKLKIYMPQEFKDELIDCFDDEELVETSENASDIYDFSETVLSAYGVIPVSKLHEIYEMYIEKISYDEFAGMLFLKCFYGGSKMINYNNEDLFHSMSFDNMEDAIKFYNEQEGNYRIYGLEEYERIEDCSYIVKTKAYSKVTRFLFENYEFTEDEFVDINLLIIFDYLYTSQLSIELADENFKNKMIEIFNINTEELNKLLGYMRNIYKEYPKWRKRGNK